MNNVQKLMNRAIIPFPVTRVNLPGISEELNLRVNYDDSNSEDHRAERSERKYIQEKPIRERNDSEYASCTKGIDLNRKDREAAMTRAMGIIVK
jgi:hypothetical protein